MGRPFPTGRGCAGTARTGCSPWADAASAGNLEAERAVLVAELKRAAGLAGRPRAFSDEAERARVNVTRTIRQALDRVLAADPGAGRHLLGSVHTDRKSVV